MRLWLRSTLIALAALLMLPAAIAQPVRVGIVTFLSGPAAGPFGVPARNAAELMTELLNAGSVPAPYATKGFGGNPIELVIIDEAGGTQKQVAEFRNLAPRARSGALFCVGFAAESHDLAANAQAKRARKGVPLLVGNIGPATFGADDNALLLVDERGTREVPRASKLELARLLVAEIANRS